MKRTLSLTRETLTELTAEDLRAVAGGALPTAGKLAACIVSEIVCFSADPPNSQCFCPTEL